MADNNDWIAIVYKLPSMPSRIRVNVWRKLKKSGAIYYQQGVAMLPRSEHFLEFMQKLKDEIKSCGGDALLANFNFLDTSDAQDAKDKFNECLSKEYSGISEIESKIWNEIENSRKANLLNLAFLEEKLTMLGKLKKTYETIKTRDYFKISLSERVDEHINALLQKVQHYYNEFKKTVNPIDNI